jgi:hypothetical protein
MPKRNATEAELRDWVVDQLDCIVAEMDIPMNTGLIARSLAVRLRHTVASFPNVEHWYA